MDRDATAATKHSTAFINTNGSDKPSTAKA
jgi:hypothetical protein